MPLNAFDHVNLRTSRLDEMIAWYCDVLGLQQGWRPDFPFPGAWLYLGEQALVHLVGVEDAPRAAGNVTLEHFALRASGFAAFRTLLDDRGDKYKISDSEILPVVQLNIWDPDGNHIHLDFDREDYASA